MCSNHRAAPTVRLLLIDMGGVLLDMAGTQGLPDGRLDFRGREAMVRAVRAGGGKAGIDSLDELLFAPWRREYAKRYEKVTEADWSEPLDRFAQAVGFSGDPLELLATWFRPYADRVAPLPGAAKGLEVLDRLPLKKVLVSNVPAPGGLYRRLLALHGMADGFDALLFSYDHGHRKPSPAMIRTALEQFDCVPEHALMIGDRCSADGGAARAAGVGFAWIRSHYDKGPSPDLTIDALADLPELLELRGDRVVCNGWNRSRSEPIPRWEDG